MTFVRTLALAFIISAPAPLLAADFSDPTWPCVARKVESLSLGLMWPHALEDTQKMKESVQSHADQLADALSVRRIELEELRQEVARFADSVGGDPAALGYVFERTFHTLDERRTQIIGGIGDFSLSQIALAEQIDETRQAMNTALAAAEPDYDAVDALEEKLDWDTVIHTDRQRSIVYLCETPQLIERRVFAIGQLLQEFIVTE